jgi:hypothetical protein
MSGFVTNLLIWAMVLIIRGPRTHETRAAVAATEFAPPFAICIPASNLS